MKLCEHFAAEFAIKVQQKCSIFIMNFSNEFYNLQNLGRSKFEQVVNKRSIKREMTFLSAI